MSDWTWKDIWAFVEPAVKANRAAWHAKNPRDGEPSPCWVEYGLKDLCGCQRAGDYRAPTPDTCPDRLLARTLVADALFGLADARHVAWLPPDEDDGELLAGAVEACAIERKPYLARRLRNGRPIDGDDFVRAEKEREPKAKIERERYGFDDLAALPPMPALVEGLLGEASITMLLGKGGSYKSFMALGWSLALATGEPWCGHPVAEPRPVTYVAGEDLRGQHGRTAAYLAGHGLDAPDASMLSFVPGFQLDDRVEVDALIADSKARGDGLIVLDTLHKMTANLDENSNTAMGVALAAIERIRTETGAAVLVLHHTGHEGVRARGASALEDDADTVWLLAGDGKRRRSLACRKQRNVETPEPVGIEFVKCADSGFVRLLDAATASSDDHVIEVATKQVVRGDDITPEQAVTVLAAMGCPPDASYNATWAFITEHGLKITNRVTRDAVKLRKAA